MCIKDNSICLFETISGNKRYISFFNYPDALRYMHLSFVSNDVILNYYLRSIIVDININ